MRKGMFGCAPEPNCTFKKNKLVSQRFREQLFHSVGFHSQELEQRASGRTTGIALSVIGEAMRKPGEKVALLDHHDSPQSHRRLADLIYSIVCLLKLEHFVIEQEPSERCPTLRFDVYEEVRYRV